MAASGTLVIRFIGDLREFQRATASMSKQMTAMGTTLTKGVTVPLVGAGIAAGKTAMDFEKSMSQIKGLVGASERQMKRYTKVILTDGPKWGKAPMELSEALYFVTSSGFQGAKALDILEKSARASTAGLGSTQTVADLLTSAMNAYRDQGLGAAKATDVLAKAVELGKLESEEFAGQMGQVLPVASSMGVRFEEVSAALASMSMSGTSASEGTTQLRGILSTLLKPTQEAEKALGGVGLSSEGLRQQLQEKGLLSVLETLTTRFKGNTAATAQVFGNVRALTGVMNMMGGNVAQTRDVFAQMENATGSMDKAFRAAAETSQFKLDKAMAQIRATLIVLGGDILPMVSVALEHVAVWVSKASDGWTNLSPGMRQVALAGAAVAAVAGPLLLVMGKILSTVAMLTPHVRLVMLAFGALVAIFTAARSQSSGFGETLRTIAGFFTDGKFASAVTKVGKALGDFWADLLPTLKAVGGEIARALVPAFRLIADVISDTLLPAFAKMLPIVSPIIKFLVRLIGDILVGAIKGAAQFIKGFVDVVAGVFNLVAALVNGEWRKAWEAVKQIVGGVINAVVGAIKVWFNLGLLALFRQGIKALLKSWKSLWDNVGKMASAGWKWVTGLFTKATGAISKVVVGAVKGYLNLWASLFKTLLNLARSGWRFVTQMFVQSLRLIGRAVADAWKSMTRVWSTGTTAVRNAVVSLWTKFLRPTFDKVADMVRKTVPNAFDRGVDAITRIWNRLKEAARKPVAFLVNTVYTDGIRRVVNAIPGVPDLPAIKFAQGGVMPGYTPGRDVHQWVNPRTGQQLHLSGGEAYMRPEFTKAVGGEAGVHRLNMLARMGKPLSFFLGGVMPASGQVSQHSRSDYSFARWAGDINIPGSGDYGNPVRAWKSGVVSAVRYLGDRSYGRYMTVRHAKETSLYAHLSAVLARSGQAVQAGQTIARVGNIGRSSGPHLHFEIRGGGGPISGGTGGGSGFLGTIGGLFGKLLGQGGSLLGNVFKMTPFGAWASKLSGMGPWGSMLGDMVGHISGDVKDYIRDKVLGIFGGGTQFAGTGALSGVLGKGGTMALRAMVKAQASQRGWGSGDQWAALTQIISRESGWRPNAQNPRSTAYGLFQFLDATWGTVGGRKTSDPSLQTTYGLRYIAQKYGSPVRAWAHWQRNHSYDTGGLLGHMGVAVNRSGKPERVLDPVTTRNFAIFTAALNTMAASGAGRMPWAYGTTADLGSASRCHHHQQQMTLVGRLELVNGEAYVRGIAEYVVDDALDMQDTTSRMGGLR